MLLTAPSIPSASGAPQHPRHIPGLDFFRAVAISLVLLYHFGAPVSGPLGVMIFFVLSGFLITRLLLNELAKSGTISLSRFYSRRCLRIFPTFYACWALTTFLMYVHGEHIPKRSALASFLYAMDYMRALSPNAQTSLHMWISWSLAIEEQFYLLWPALLLWLAIKLRKPIAGTGLIVIAVWVHRAILYVLLHATSEYVYNAFDTRLDALLVGGLLAMLIRDKRFDSVRIRLTRSQWSAMLPVALLVAVSIAETSAIQYPRWAQILSFTLQPAVVGVLLLQLVHWAGRDWHILEHPWIRFLARISYALYLYHIVAMDEVSRLNLAHPKWYSAAFTLALAIGSYYLIERPVLAIRDGKSFGFGLRSFSKKAA
ncbi:MAG: acyltransferase family protein [Bryobacteraceae bacterium]